MAQDRISMPSSGAGITQYYNETKSKISISPQMVLALSALIVILIIILNSL
ncbi:MAG: preprotein translocase subunit Sec61beta [Candidatus Nanoarchaeia archaeon]|nr:preprotein translocase subunit Sec61beta [Candidatus Nanoarchaeia archaeon]